MGFRLWLARILAPAHFHELDMRRLMAPRLVDLFRRSFTPDRYGPWGWRP